MPPRTQVARRRFGPDGRRLDDLRAGIDVPALFAPPIAHRRRRVAVLLDDRLFAPAAGAVDETVEVAAFAPVVVAAAAAVRLNAHHRHLAVLLLRLLRTGVAAIVAAVDVRTVVRAVVALVVVRRLAGRVVVEATMIAGFAGGERRCGGGAGEKHESQELTHNVFPRITGLGLAIAPRPLNYG